MAASISCGSFLRVFSLQERSTICDLHQGPWLLETPISHCPGPRFLSQPFTEISVVALSRCAAVMINANILVLYSAYSYSNIYLKCTSKLCWYH